MAQDTNNKKLTLTLHRGDKGLGFNIKGGTDVQYVPGDSGIFISKIKEDGTAALDGRLKVGDKILEVNGQNLQNVPHSVAVETFLNAGDTVVMTVIQNAASLQDIQQKRKTQAKGGMPYQIIIPVAIGVALVGAAFYVRSKYLT